MFAGGLDPGNTGALGIWDMQADKLFTVWDLPNYKVTINKTTRTRLDEDELQALFELCKDMDMKLLVIEDVSKSTQQKQAASRAFQFGDTFGVIRTLARMCGLTIKMASPTVWKPLERVSRDEQAIVNKATVEFPEHKHMWTGKKGGLRHDRCEAAFLARYAAHRMWPAMQERMPLRQALDPALTVAAVRKKLAK